MLNMQAARTTWLADLPIFFVALFVLAVDQLSKAWVRANLAPNESIPADAPVRLTHVTNTGAAFGLFQDRSIMFVAVAIVVIAVILLYRYQLPAGNQFIRMALGLQLGGALGNLTDRLTYGHVTDFIDLRVWPVFNIADSAIVVGVVILAARLLLVKDDEPA